MTKSYKRAEYVSLGSMLLSVVFFLATFLFGQWSGFFGITSMSWFILSSGLIWFVLWLQFHQRRLAHQEKLDISQMTKEDEGTTIFHRKSGTGELFASSQRHLELLEKWFIPIFSGLIAVYQVGIGLYLLKVFGERIDVERSRPLACAMCMTAVAFVSFLMSRYATGLSSSEQKQQCRSLRGGGSSLLCIAILSFALAVGLALAQFKIFVLVDVIAYVVPGLLVVLGVETGLNVVFDIYRPRLTGQYSRSAFDSRLLGILNEPGEILHTAAGAIDYQFGFKVSQTWFYKLLEKAVVPLVFFAAVVLYLLSCLVVVGPDEQAIIEHFGNPLTASGEHRIVGPGISFKWPWPVDIAHKYPVKKVFELSIGFTPELDEHGHVDHSPKLWGKRHHHEEYVLLVASEHAGDKLAEGAVPVSLVVAAIPVQYRVKDLYSYMYNHKDPAKHLESICYGELTRFGASSILEVDNEADKAKSLLGAGREHAKYVLTDRIQRAADKAGLGVEIVFLGVSGLHPPVEVASDYQKVVGAAQRKQALILNAYAERNKILSSLAGSVKEAEHLYKLTADYQLAKDSGDSENLERIGAELDRAFSEAKGDIFTTLRESKSYAFKKAILAKAEGERFASQLKAYNAQKEIYIRQQRLLVFEESLGKVRKFVVIADEDDTQVFIIDVQEKLTPGLYDIGVLEESSEK